MRERKDTSIIAFTCYSHECSQVSKGVIFFYIAIKKLYVLKLAANEN